MPWHEDISETPPSTLEDVMAVFSEVPDGEEGNWLALFQCKLTFYSFVALK